MKRTLVLALLLALGATQAQGQTPGSLDDTFGNQGHVLADLSAGNRYDEAATTVLIQADGKRVLVVDRYPNLQLIRLNTDGTYDQTFGHGGFSQGAPFSLFGGPRSNAAIQADGKIVVAGETEYNSSTFTDFGVARWNTDGTLDASFGTGGLVTTNFGYWDEGNMVRIQADGRIVVAGSVNINSHSFIGLVRYNTDGTLDANFGVGGKYVNVSDFNLSDMAFTPEGKIIVLGDLPGSDFALVRFNGNGIIDTGFGVQGIASYDWNLTTHRPRPRTLAVQADGRLVLGGALSNGTNNDLFVVRYDANGVIDPSFSGNGFQTTHIGGSETVRDLIVQPDGRIVVAGDVFSGANQPTRFALARYLPNGDLDGSFGVQGTQITTFSGFDGASATAVALHADGDITAAGAAWNNFSDDVAVATYDVQGTQDVDGYPVQRVVAYLTDTGDTRFNASAVQADGKLVAAGYAWNGRDYDFVVARFNVDGSPDPTFGVGGYQTTDFPMEGSGDEGAWSVGIQPDGKIVVSGAFFGFIVGGALPVARYLPDGTLDASFGTGGLAQHDLPGIFEDGYSIAFQPDGKILIGGDVLNGDFDFTVSRLNPDGTLDGGFGSGGVVTSNFGYQDIIFGLALQPDGKILATGNTSLPNSFDGFDYCTVRYNADGTLDTGFGASGRVTTDFGGGSDFAEAIALQPDGGILVGGGAPIGGDFQYGLARYDMGGVSDPVFGSSGLQTLGFLGYDIATSINLQDDGGILMAGFTEDGSTDPASVHFGLTRFTSSGALDLAFGDNGKVVSDFDGDSWAFSMGRSNRRIYVAGMNRAFDPFLLSDKIYGIAATYWTGPPTAEEQIDSTITDILELPNVPAGIKQSLNAKLNAALNALAAMDTMMACNHLRALLNELQAQAGKRKLTLEQAETLMDQVLAIVATLGCDNILHAISETLPPLPNAPSLPEDTAQEAMPLRFALDRNWPNPFRGFTQFSYQLPYETQVSLKIYNVAGQAVATVVDGVQGPGWKTAKWDARGMPSGVYYYRMTAGSFSKVHTMLLIR